MMTMAIRSGVLIFLQSLVCAESNTLAPLISSGESADLGNEGRQ